MMTTTLVLPIVFLAGSCFLMSIKTAIQRFREGELEEVFHRSRINFFLFRWIRLLFPSERSHPLRDFLSLSGLITIVGYGISGTLYLNSTGLYGPDLGKDVNTSLTITSFILSMAILVGAAIFVYVIVHLFASRFVIAALKLFSLITSLYLLILFPIVWPILFIEKLIAPDPKPKEPKISSKRLKKHLLELIKDLELEDLLDPRDKKLIRSIAHFGDLVVREIMVPRVRMICLPETSTIFEALSLFVKERYSRIPVYKESIDHITGVLLYKDLMAFCLKALEKDIQSIQSVTIQSLTCSILYAPENRKIHDLFQEIRLEKIHLAIVVNEYGCTEGMVTIEDILEELVGSEIRDEHDEDEEILFKKMQDKSWIVDAKMTVVDAEREFGFPIPHNAEYETLAGFISWKMGMIPPPGTLILEDHFNIKILSSDARQIHKVKISAEKKIPAR